MHKKYFNLLLNSIHNDSYNLFVEKLFNHISIINEYNVFGETLLHYCSFYGLIDKYYALINLDCKPTNTKENNNLLHYACYSGKDPFIIVELVKLGIAPLDKNIKGETSIHLCSDEKIAHYLNVWCLRNNINIENILDNEGNTVLHTAFKYKNENIVNYWLQQNKNMNKQLNNNGFYYYQVQQEQHNFCKKENNVSN